MATLKKLIAASDHVVGFQTYFEGIAVASQTIHTLEAQEAQMKRLWSTFESIYEVTLENYEDIKEKLNWMLWTDVFTLPLKLTRRS
ncbi:hypothetical protein EVAR_69963_1 [Eumeta japonica]|uniref:Uncharacterized protein n=1 Tax=Eumeta variegata TaxID=151549 RepID=A0A4C2AFI1_EUMVA|nr:hypothetical protein EVAR_69963_1 [Eumeta japonica]